MERVVFQKWQLRKLIFWFLLLTVVSTVYLSCAAWSLYSDKMAEETYWTAAVQEGPEDPAAVAALSAHATHVTTGVYVENLKAIDMKNSSYRLVAKVWFRWRGDEELNMVNSFHVYNGTTNKLTVLRDEVIGGEHYQLCTLDVTVFKNFWTKRFPLESHQLRFYIEPDEAIDRVVLEGDYENCSVNPSLSIAGYHFKRFANSVYTNEYVTTYGEPGVDRGTVTSEFMTQIELNRSGFGLYAKCFIALVGTTLWVFITLFLCTFHRVDPLGMIPAALFGTVTNIMVGANLLPDALEIGLLEYVNVWGILTIVAGALAIININRIRNKYNDNKFATLYGRIITFSLVFVVLAGHVLMPLAAYLW